MSERSLGARGTAVSVLGLGCNNIGGQLDRPRRFQRVTRVVAVPTGEAHQVVEDLRFLGLRGTTRSSRHLPRDRVTLIRR